MKKKVKIIAAVGISILLPASAFALAWVWGNSRVDNQAVVQARMTYLVKYLQYRMKNSGIKESALVLDDSNVIIGIPWTRQELKKLLTRESVTACDEEWSFFQEAVSLEQVSILDPEIHPSHKIFYHTISTDHLDGSGTCWIEYGADLFHSYISVTMHDVEHEWFTLQVSSRQ